MTLLTGFQFHLQTQLGFCLFVCLWECGCPMDVFPDCATAQVFSQCFPHTTARYWVFLCCSKGNSSVVQIVGSECTEPDSLPPVTGLGQQSFRTASSTFPEGAQPGFTASHSRAILFMVSFLLLSSLLISCTVKWQLKGQGP